MSLSLKFLKCFGKPLHSQKIPLTPLDLGDTMTLIWAHGQRDNFYLDDQIKYHGKTRGINSLGEKSNLKPIYYFLSNQKPFFEDNYEVL